MNNITEDNMFVYVPDTNQSYVLGWTIIALGEIIVVLSLVYAFL